MYYVIFNQNLASTFLLKNLRGTAWAFYSYDEAKQEAELLMETNGFLTYVIVTDSNE